MTTLAASKPRAQIVGNLNKFPMIASDIIYNGAAVGLDTAGRARPLVAGDPFAGFATQKIDNSAGVAGATEIEVLRRGRVQLPITGVALTDIGRAVYANDDDAFALSGNGTFIGRVARYVSANLAEVEFDFNDPEQLIIVEHPILLVNVSAADVLSAWTPGFFGRLKKLDWITGTPVTTGSKLATFSAKIGSTAVTGGAVALTSATATPLGHVVAGSAITAANAFGPTDTISLVAASVTAFAEGAGTLVAVIGK